MSVKKIILLPLLFLCIHAMAGESGVTFLFADGQKANFAFSAKPEISVGVDGITVTSTVADQASYAFANVQRFYFDEEDTGVATIGADAECPVFRCADGIVAVSRLKASERVTVVSVNGTVVCETQADVNGNACANISGVAAGVYVVSTGSGVSFKLLKK